MQVRFVQMGPNPNASNPFLGWNLACLNIGLGFLKLGIRNAMTNGWSVLNTQIKPDPLGRSLVGNLYLEKPAHSSITPAYSMTIPIRVPNLDVYDEIIVMLDTLSATVKGTA